MKGKGTVAVLLFAVVFWAACSTGEAGLGSLESRLNGLRNAESLFSYLFYCDEPGGFGIKMVLYKTWSIDPCSFITTRGEEGGGPDTFSFIRVITNATAPGIYPVVTYTSELDIMEKPERLAAARLSGMENGRAVDKIPAAFGTVSITEAPETVEDWNAGIGFAGTLALEFPVHFTRTKECSSTSGQPAECICIDESGNLSKCEMEMNGQDCCFQLSEETVSIDIAFQASQCTKLCSSTTCVDLPCGYDCEDLH